MVWRRLRLSGLIALVTVSSWTCNISPAAFHFEIVVPPEVAEGPLDGRILLLVSNSDEPEPRFQRLRSLETPLIFGSDVENLIPGEPTVLDVNLLGFPIESISEIPPG